MWFGQSRLSVKYISSFKTHVPDLLGVVCPHRLSLYPTAPEQSSVTLLQGYSPHLVWSSLPTSMILLMRDLKVVFLTHFID